MEKFLDFLEVLQWFKPARVKSCWRTDFKNGGLRCTPQSILRSLLGYSPCLQLENWWSGRYLQPLSFPCQGLCGMAAGMYAAVVDGYRTQPAPRGGYWANSIHFPQRFTLLWKSAGRMKEQTTDVQLVVQKGSWLLIPAIQCQSSLPCLTPLQSRLPRGDASERSNDGHSCWAGKEEQNSE